MKILLTNDDGYFAAGITGLARILGENGHRCTVVAPHRCYSGTSHAMTFRKPIFVNESDEFPWKCYIIEGTPSDCVKFGLTALPEDFDCVISGINNEPNLGTDAICSGTVQAAVEGAMNGIRSISLSSYGECEADYCRIAKFFLKKFPSFLENMDAATPLSINLQPIEDAPWAVAVLGISKFTDYYTIGHHEQRGTPYSLMGEFIIAKENPVNSDVCLYKERGFHTVTPLHFDLTAHSEIAKWEKLI